MIYGISRLFRDSISKNTVNNYVKEQNKNIVRLDLVSNPLGPPKNILEFLKSINVDDLSNYPDRKLLWELKQRLAIQNNVNPENILVTAGADQAIEIVLTHVLNPGDKIGIQVPTFPRFEIVAKKLCNAEIKLFSSLENTPDSKIIMLCTPNNPTTEEIEECKLRETIKTNQDKLFVIDAVFSDFGTWNPSKLVKEFRNVIIIKSFSKSFGIPGARIGFIVSNNEIISILKQGISPFLVSTISQKIAIQCLDELEHIEKTKEFIDKEFKNIISELGINAIRKSNVPFFIFKLQDSIKIKRKLKEKGISVITEKHFNSSEKFIRVAIGERWQNNLFIKTIKEIL